MKSMEMVRSTTDPCLYHPWVEDRLVLIVLMTLSWIDDNLIIGSKKAVEKAKKELMQRFNFEDCEDLEEYLRCKVKWTRMP